MDIHSPKIHTGALGIISAAVIGLGAITLTPKADTFPVSSSFSNYLTTAEKHPVMIYCGLGCDDKADKIADQLEAAHWPVTVEVALASSPGIGVKPVEATQFAQALSLGIGQTVMVDPSHGGGWEIWIGRTPRKRDNK